jgi:hypothetical protein
VSRIRLVVGASLALVVSRFRFARLRRAMPCPYAISGLPPAMPRLLLSESRGTDLIEIVLGYGFPRAISRPLIEVATCFAPAESSVPSLGQALAGAAHRDACYARDKWEEAGGPFESPAPAQALATELRRNDRQVVVDGEERYLAIASYRKYEALQFSQGSAVVTAVARFGFPDGLSFGQVDDLEPYFAGYIRFVRSWLKPPA